MNSMELNDILIRDRLMLDNILALMSSCRMRCLCLYISKRQTLHPCLLHYKLKITKRSLFYTQCLTLIKPL